MQLTSTATNCVQRRDTELRPIDGLILKREQDGKRKEALNKENSEIYEGQLRRERRKITGKDKRRD